MKKDDNSKEFNNEKKDNKNSKSTKVVKENKEIKNNKEKNDDKVITESKKKSNVKNILLYLLFVMLFLASVALNIFYVTNKPLVKYKNDESIIFFGDSITEGYNIEKFFPSHKVVNKGKSGNRTSALLERIDKDVYEYNPSKVFILVGINDLCGDVDQEDIIFNIQNIIIGIKTNRHRADIYVEAVYPINANLIKEKNVDYAFSLTNKRVIELNQKIKKVCEESGVTYIDMFNVLSDKEGNLKELYSTDGLHLNNLGYLRVTSVLKDYVGE